MTQQSEATRVPAIDRPVSEKNLSGVKNFFGLYGGEHIAATEFVIGALLVTWGVPASTILLGLAIGNILAVLSFVVGAAAIGTSTRLTLYTYLKRVLGPYVQKFYNLVWGVCSIGLAASGIGVSATALREVIGIPIQREWYPTSLAFVLVVVGMGIVVALVAANGFEACAKFSTTAVPWMITIFFVGAVVALPQLATATGVEVRTVGEVWQLIDHNIGSGSGNANLEYMTIWHVACFAWLINLAWHLGLNDMGLFRFARNYKYGYITAIGMFIGHYFAWITVAIMGTAAAAVLRQSLTELDPGSVTYAIFGLTGITAVLVAGWTTANPTIYRAALSLNQVMPQLTHKHVTYVVGILMTVLACFPAMTNISNVVQILGWATVGVGAIALMEHFVFPRIGFTRYWSMYRGANINWAATIAWATSIAFVLIMLNANSIHPNFIFIPEFVIAAVSYIVLAGVMGARGDYSTQEAQEMELQRQLTELVDRDMEGQLAEGAQKEARSPGLERNLPYIAYTCLALLVVIAFLTYAGVMAVTTFKTMAFLLTIAYFVFNGTATYLQYKNEAAALH